MAAKRPNIRSAAADLVLLAVAMAAGGFGAPLAFAGLLYGVSVLTWWWTRRTALGNLPLRPRVTQSAIALVMLAVGLGIFYGIGLAIGGHL